MGLRTRLQKAVPLSIAIIATFPVIVAGAAVVAHNNQVAADRKSTATACHAYNLATSRVHDGFAVKLVPQLRKFPTQDPAKAEVFYQQLIADFTFPALDCSAYPIRFEP